jgi:hypothetical protein
MRLKMGSPLRPSPSTIVSSMSPVGGIFLERIQLDLWFFFSHKIEEYQ